MTPPGEERKIENTELRKLIDMVKEMFDQRLTKTEEANDTAHEVIFNKLDKHNNFQGRLQILELYMKIAIVVFGVGGSIVSFIFYNLLSKLLDKVSIILK